MCSTIGAICGHCFRKKHLSDWKDIRDGNYSEERESSQDSEPSTQHLKSQLNRDMGVCVCVRVRACACSQTWEEVRKEEGNRSWY